MHDRIREWLESHARIEESSSAEAFYQTMDRQCLFDIPGVFCPFDPLKESHWLTKVRDMAYANRLRPKDLVVDIGTGDGFPALSIAPYVGKVVGIDLSPRRIAVAEANRRKLGLENAEFRVMNAEALDFDAVSVDAVVSATAIEQANHSPAVLTEIARVLRPGGLLIAAFQDFASCCPSYARVEVVNAWRTGQSATLVYKQLDPQANTEDVFCIGLRPIAAETPSLVTLLEGASEYRDGVVLHDLQADRAGLGLLRHLAGHIESCRHYRIRHYGMEQLYPLLRKSGFNSIKKRAYRSAHVRSIIRSWSEFGLLPGLAPYMDALCRGLERMELPETAVAESALIVAERC